MPIRKQRDICSDYRTELQLVHCGYCYLLFFFFLQLQFNSYDFLRFFINHSQIIKLGHQCIQLKEKNSAEGQGRLEDGHPSHEVLIRVTKKVYIKP
jgi:hypothetical protein